jgi:hypothetical protein
MANTPGVRLTVTTETTLPRAGIDRMNNKPVRPGFRIGYGSVVRAVSA